jgi:hypothetical protein
MVGAGLIQIAVYGTQDIFLTGTPQITFFKMVYRRNTNFAIEAIQQVFDGTQDFGRTLSCVIDKVGDMMFKTYLEIDLPKVLLAKNPNDYIITLEYALDEYNKITNLFNIVVNYLAADTTVIRKLFQLLNINNVTMSDIETTMNSPQMIGELLIQRSNLINAINNIVPTIATLKDQIVSILAQINRVDIKIRFDSIITTLDRIYANSPNLDQIKRKTLIDLINNSIYLELQSFNNIFYNDKLAKEKIYNSILNKTYTENYKFAWVEEIGNSIIEQIEVLIGGYSVDRHIGQWLSVWSKLVIHPYHRKNYNKLIGNVPELFMFDDKGKPAYKLMIPLFFWFCKTPGLAVPLVALRYHDILFNLKLREFRDCAYIENTNGIISIDNIQNLYGININNISLWIDYAYLDHQERRRFAQSSHEYLIEQVQTDVFENITSSQSNLQVNFANPCKEIIWTIQPYQRLSNPDGYTKVEWNNFSIANNMDNPINTAWIELNSQRRVNQFDSTYFNYLQPYQHHTRTPSPGINLFSFSLVPEELQPSSTCNLSRISNTNLNFILDDNYIAIATMGSRLNVFAINYNILRIYSGMAGVAFQLSA